MRIVTSLSVPHEQRSRVQTSLYPKSSPSPASAKVGARRLVLEICNRRIVTCAHAVARCARFGRAGLVRRIRRAPARSLLSLRWEKARLVTIRTTTTAGNRDRDGRVELRCHTPPSPSTNIPGESRSIRPSGCSPHLPRTRPLTRTPGALSRALCFVGPRAVRGAVRAVVLREESERPECAPSLLSSATTGRARDPRLHPRRAPAPTWRPSRESFAPPSRAGRLLRVTSGSGPFGPLPAVPADVAFRLPTSLRGLLDVDESRSAFRHRSGGPSDAETSGGPASSPCSTEEP